MYFCERRGSSGFRKPLLHEIRLVEDAFHGKFYTYFDVDACLSETQSSHMGFCTKKGGEPCTCLTIGIVLPIEDLERVFAYQVNMAEYRPINRRKQLMQQMRTEILGKGESQRTAETVEYSTLVPTEKRAPLDFSPTSPSHMKTQEVRQVQKEVLEQNGEEIMTKPKALFLPSDRVDSQRLYSKPSATTYSMATAPFDATIPPQHFATDQPSFTNRNPPFVTKADEILCDRNTIRYGAVAPSFSESQGRKRQLPTMAMSESDSRKQVAFRVDSFSRSGHTNGISNKLSGPCTPTNEDVWAANTLSPLQLEDMFENEGSFESPRRDDGEPYRLARISPSHVAADSMEREDVLGNSSPIPNDVGPNPETNLSPARTEGIDLFENEEAFKEHFDSVDPSTMRDLLTAFTKHKDSKGIVSQPMFHQPRKGVVNKDLPSNFYSIFDKDSFGLKNGKEYVAVDPAIKPVTDITRDPMAQKAMSVERKTNEFKQLQIRHNASSSAMKRLEFAALSAPDKAVKDVYQCINQRQTFLLNNGGKDIMGESTRGSIEKLISKLEVLGVDDSYVFIDGGAACNVVCCHVAQRMNCRVWGIEYNANRTYMGAVNFLQAIEKKLLINEKVALVPLDLFSLRSLEIPRRAKEAHKEECDEDKKVFFAFDEVYNPLLRDHDAAICENTPSVEIVVSFYASKDANFHKVLEGYGFEWNCSLKSTKAGSGGGNTMHIYRRRQGHSPLFSYANTRLTADKSTFVAKDAEKESLLEIRNEYYESLEGDQVPMARCSFMDTLTSRFRDKLQQGVSMETIYDRYLRPCWYGTSKDREKVYEALQHESWDRMRCCDDNETARIVRDNGGCNILLIDMTFIRSAATSIEDFRFMCDSSLMDKYESYDSQLCKRIEETSRNIVVYTLSPFQSTDLSVSTKNTHIPTFESCESDDDVCRLDDNCYTKIRDRFNGLFSQVVFGHHTKRTFDETVIDFLCLLRTKKILEVGGDGVFLPMKEEILSLLVRTETQWTCMYNLSFLCGEDGSLLWEAAESISTPDWMKGWRERYSLTYGELERLAFPFPEDSVVKSVLFADGKASKDVVFNGIHLAVRRMIMRSSKK